MIPVPLRIAHISNEPFGAETANGVQQVVYCLAHAQAGMGLPVAVFSRDDHALNVLGDSGPVAHPPRRTAAGLGTPQWQRLLARHSVWPSAADVLAWQPHVVHFHSVHIPQNVALAAELARAGIPYCVTVHGALFDAALRRQWLKKKIFHLFFERRYLNEARFIHALSVGESEAIRHCGLIQPIIEVPNGLPPDVHAKPLQPDALYARRPELRGRRVFMFIGRLDPWQKGLDLLLDAFAFARLREAALVLVGPDWRGSRRDLTRRAERLGILSDVVFLDPVYGQNRANLLAGADIFVHTSRWEGLSMAVLAAAAAGKASLVTSEADPHGRLQRAEAAIVVEQSVSSIAEGLVRAANLAGDEVLAMGTRARQVAETQVTWPQVAERMVEAYTALCVRDEREQVSNQRAPERNRDLLTKR